MAALIIMFTVYWPCLILGLVAYMVYDIFKLWNKARSERVILKVMVGGDSEINSKGTNNGAWANYVLAFFIIILICIKAFGETISSTSKTVITTTNASGTITKTIMEERPAPLKLNWRCEGEEKFKGSYIHTKYFSEEEKKLRVLIQNDNGMFVDVGGELFDTNGLRNDMAPFVVDVNGTVYSSLDDSPVVVEHSSYVSGKEVLCAGTWHVTNGDIQMITDRSYRYQTSKKVNLDWCIEYFKSRGMDFTKVPIRYQSQEI